MSPYLVTIFYADDGTRTHTSDAHTPLKRACLPIPPHLQIDTTTF